MTDVQVLLMFLFLDSKMAKQQLQKWELKFVTELEPLEGASPVCLFGEKIGLSVGPVSTSILRAPILGAGKRLPKWESAPLLLQDSQNGGRIVCFFEGIAWQRSCCYS